MLLCCSHEKLYIKEIMVADQGTVKVREDQVLLQPSNTDVAFLVVSDPFE